MQKILTISLFVFGTWSYAQIYARSVTGNSQIRPDISSLGNALKLKQQRYDINVARIQSSVDRIANHIDHLDVSEERKKELGNNLEKCYMNSPNIDYSSNNQTTQLIEIIYQCFNSKLK